MGTNLRSAGLFPFECHTKGEAVFPYLSWFLINWATVTETVPCGGRRRRLLLWLPLHSCRQLSVAALPHYTLSFQTKTRSRERFKDRPLTQVGLFTVTLEPRPSWPQLLLPNMKSFPFSVETNRSCTLVRKRQLLSTRISETQIL